MEKSSSTLPGNIYERDGCWGKIIAVRDDRASFLPFSYLL